MNKLISTLSVDYSVYPEVATHTVYVLINPETFYVYYGCTSNTIANRFDGHLNELKDGVHHNGTLQALYNAGFTDWTVHQLAVGTKAEMRALERRLFTEDMHSLNTGDKPHLQAARITRDELEEAVKLHKQGYMYRQIAAKLNRSRDTVGHMIRGSYNNLYETAES